MDKKRLEFRFQDMAVGYAFSVLGDFGQAEDAAQEAFVQAYRDLHLLREPQAFPAWLRRVVFKYCDRQTRGKRLQTLPLDTARDAVSKEPSPMQSSERSELRERILKAINALPEHERAAVSLFYINGYSQAEVGAFLGVPAKTVKSRLHSARGKLRERMMEMVEETLKQNVPDETFAERVTKAIRVYTAKGPAENSTGSETDMAMRAQTAELLESGEEGFDIAVALSQSPQKKARAYAAVYFGLKGDPRGRKHLARLLRDEAVCVRSRAVRFYARFFRPDACHNAPLEPGLCGTAVPDDIEHFVPLLDDEDLKIRWYTALAIGVYAAFGDSRVDAAMAKALEDPHHKVRHAAAMRMRIVCPDCGTIPDGIGRFSLEPRS